MNEKKKFILINSVLIFLLGFIVHNIYGWFPSFFTVIFPVNESLYEHIKLIFISPIIIGLIRYFIFNKKEKYNNYFFSLYLSIMANIVIFYAMFLPFYYRFGENLLVTLIIYFISILISQYINYLIITKTKNNSLLNIIGIILLITNYLILIYFTYNPLKNDFFFDPNNEVYGIYK